MFTNLNNKNQIAPNYSYSFLPNGTKRIKLDSNKRIVPDSEADSFTTGGGGSTDPSIITTTLTVKGDGNSSKFSVEDPTESKVFFIDTILKDAYFRGHNFDIGFSPSSTLATFRADTIDRYISFYSRLDISSTHINAFKITDAVNTQVFNVDTANKNVTLNATVHIRQDNEDILSITSPNPTVKHWFSCIGGGNNLILSMGHPDHTDPLLSYLECWLPKCQFNTKNFFIKGTDASIFKISNFTNTTILNVATNSSPAVITFTANLLPSAHNTFSLGSGGTRFSGIFANALTSSSVLTDRITYYINNPTGGTSFTATHTTISQQSSAAGYNAHGSVNSFYQRFHPSHASGDHNMLTIGCNMKDNDQKTNIAGGAAFISISNSNRFNSSSVYPAGAASSGTIFFGSIENSATPDFNIAPRAFISSNMLGPCGDNRMFLGSNDLRFRECFINTVNYMTLNALSDRSQKKDIYYFQNSVIPLINSLKPCHFRYIHPDFTQRCFGFIAQDVEESIQTIYPDMGPEGVVTYRYEEVEGQNVKVEGSASLNQLAILPFLVKAVQELAAEVQLLKDEIAILKQN